MAYNINFQLNIMWLDGVLLLPLIMLGIDKLINEKEELLKLSTNLKNDNNNKEEIEKVAKEFVSLKINLTISSSSIEAVSTV